MKAGLIAGCIVMAAFAAGAEPIGGSGSWGIDGDTLIVSNGTVSIDEQLPDSVTTARINEGAMLVFGTDNPFAGHPTLYVFGTLDLNGHPITAHYLTSRHLAGDEGYCLEAANKTYYLASSEALVTNSAASDVTLTVDDGRVASSARIAPNVKIALPGSGNAQILGTAGAADSVGPKEIATGSSLLAITRPSSLIFVFKEVAGTGNNRKLRLSELVPTCKGVPLSELGYGVSCIVQTPGLDTAGTELANWTDGDLSTMVYASSSHIVTPETPHVIVVNFTDGKYPAVDGYRFGTPLEPAYAPKSWDVYAYRSDTVGLVLVDSRQDDPVNRPASGEGTAKDAWSNQLSDNYTFRWPLGNTVGSETDLVLDGATRFTEGEPLTVGAVSGAATITLNEDSVLCPKSLADWTGDFSVTETWGFLGEGPGVRLSSVRGAAEQRFAYGCVNLAVGAAEADSTVKVLYDGTTAGTYARTRLRDGAGTLGVTVRAPGAKQYLAAQGSDYTGPTDIESGTLVVHGKTAEVTCSFIKIVVKEVPLIQDSCLWGMNEFKVYDAAGNEVGISDATNVTSSTGQFINTSTNGKKLNDNDITTRMLPSGGKAENMPAVTIMLPKPISFAAYDWYPSVNNGAPTKYRYPLKLELWVSSDGRDWSLVEKRTNPKPAADADYLKWQGGENHFRLSSLAEAQDAADLPTLNAAVCGTSSEGASFVECVKARYFRFTCFETFYGWNFESDNSKGWCVSELSLRKNGELVDWPTDNANFSVSAKAGLTLWTASGSADAKFADNIRTAEEAAAAGIQNRALYSNGLGYIQIDAGEELEFDAYSLWTPPPANAVKRLPRGWMLRVSANGINWHTIDVHRPAEGDKCPSDSYREYGPFSLRDRWPIAGAGNVLGDRSKVTIASGAALRLDAAFERVGGLAGAGSVDLCGHTLDLAAQDTSTVFSGAVAGAGTLVISGEGEQAFDNADLSGVATLKLAAGTMSGSASFGGKDLSLDFAGGALGASLAGIGSLSVTGEVICRPPASAIAARGWKATLVTATAMDAAVQAAFRATRFDVPRGWIGTVSVEPNCVTFDVAAPGLLLIIK